MYSIPKQAIPPPPVPILKHKQCLPDQTNMLLQKILYNLAKPDLEINPTYMKGRKFYRKDRNIIVISC